MIDYASEIKSRVTMPQILTAYGIPVKTHKRIPCPIHHGNDNNFSFKDDHFKCWVCGAQGDVISFVQQYFDLDFKDAIGKLNADFSLGLPMGSSLSGAEMDKLQKTAAQRLEEKRRTDRMRKLLWSKYHAALDKWIALDMIKREEAPRTPLGKMTDAYVYACQHIDEALAAVDDAQIEMEKFENGLKTAN